MHTTRVARSVTVALAATLLLAAAGHASASRLSFNYAGMRVTFPGLEFNGGGLEIRCPTTLQGRLEATTVNKVERSVIGRITDARVAEASCTGGARVVAFNGVENYNGGRPPTSLPWSISYENFLTTLPNISRIRVFVQGMRFGVTSAFCTGQYGTATDAVTFELARSTIGSAVGMITGVIAQLSRSNVTLFRQDAGIGCPATATVGTNVGSMAAVERAESIYVTLTN